MNIALCSLVLVLATGAGPTADSGALTKQGWLGVYTENLSEAMLAALDIERGVLVARVAPGSPAEKAGFAKGDVITSLAGEGIDDATDLRWTVRDRPGQEVMVAIRRKGKDLKLRAELESRDRAKWLEHFDFGGFPGEALIRARDALGQVGPEIEREIRPFVSVDSLRAELDELKAELQQLKDQLKKQTKGM